MGQWKPNRVYCTRCIHLALARPVCHIHPTGYTAIGVKGDHCQGVTRVATIALSECCLTCSQYRAGAYYAGKGGVEGVIETAHTVGGGIGSHHRIDIS